MNEVFQPLFNSFQALEDAIESAMRSAEGAQHGSSELVLGRLSTYKDILRKQRAHARTVRSQVDSGDWAVVMRHIKIINELSRMIRDDARELSSQIVDTPALETEVISDEPVDNSTVIDSSGHLSLQQRELRRGRFLQ